MGSSWERVKGDRDSVSTSSGTSTDLLK